MPSRSARASRSAARKKMDGCHTKIFGAMADLLQLAKDIKLGIQKSGRVRGWPDWVPEKETSARFSVSGIKRRVFSLKKRAAAARAKLRRTFRKFV